jgi:spermidine synthase
VSALLLISAFAVATCGLVYELLAGTLASYLLGDSVTQFSTIIGTYLFAMGVGSWCTRFFRKDLLAHFARIEVLVGLVGGCSALCLFWIYGHVIHFRVALYGTVFTIGALVGVEVPLLLRILNGSMEFRDVVARVFAADYVGALLAALLFPLLLVPELGLVRTGFLFGVLNVAVAIVLLWKLQPNPILWASRAFAVLTLAGLALGFSLGEQGQSYAESNQYPGQVIYAASTPYQRVVLSSVAGEMQLFLNGNLQFSGRDEYRYHEALVHPAMTRAAAPRKVLILGGGDGLAAREVLRYPGVEQIQLIDLDPGVTTLFQRTPWLQRLNNDSLNSGKLRITSADAFEWLRDRPDRFDVVIIDFPDPSNYSVGKLYSTSFYRRVAAVLSPGGVVVVQATSPFVASKAYWCIVATLAAEGFATKPYHALVPSFGDWGFVLATRSPWQEPRALPPGLRFLDEQTESTLFVFPRDTQVREVEANRLNDQVLVRYFEDEWSRYLGG